ncbi:hypothetical protein [Nostoc sp. MS1]|uniref:hypothetical protein n=1 Tax=Nostoc sp. MS1 TaxID=2764711 RepID=UPI001CC544DE|nr:hypothetical protein [Nostoc sp. MS1]BCL38461.1 hypothetical protein NSMS1_49080 [Nostoc sp. MS1]
MKPNVSTIVSGLKLLTFQGITVIAGDIVIATVEGEILRCDADRNITPWINIFNYGIPTGIVSYNDGLAVVLSGQESGHFLMRVTPQAQVSLVAELSQIVGEFGAPFGVSVHKYYYPYYIVAASTDVIGSAGLVARVSPSGQVSILTRLPSSCFGIVGNYPDVESNVGDGLHPSVAHRIVVTQEDGRLLEVSLSGKVTEIVNLQEIGLGFPSGIACNQDSLAITTSTGWVVLIDSQGKLLPLINLVDVSVGEPTTITSFGNDWVVATKAGDLLRLS